MTDPAPPTPPDADGPPAASPTRIVFIASQGRSGSTLASRLLHEVPGWCALGEVIALYERAENRGKRCGCGRPLPECPIWGPVVADLEHACTPLPESPLLTPHPIRRQLPRLAWPRTRRAQLARSLGMDAVLRRMYPAVARRSGARVLVDSSKSPRLAYLLDQLPWCEVTMVHIVRDPRGVVHSLSRPKESMRAGRMRDTVRGWVAHNLEGEIVAGLLSRPSVRIRYEDMVGDPDGFVRRVVDAVGDDVVVPPLVAADGTVHLGPHHIVRSNPDKRVGGPTPVVLRDEWRREMPRARQSLVTALTAPLLLRYRYPLRGRGTRATER